jgi:hypothetical protein
MPPLKKKEIYITYYKNQREDSKMKASKKLICIMLALTMAVSVLAGCSSPNAGGDQANSHGGNTGSAGSATLKIGVENKGYGDKFAKKLAEAFEAKTVDYSRDFLVLQVTGERRHIDDFINVMRDFGIVEICRTGIVALQRGDATIRQEANL